MKPAARTRDRSGAMLRRPSGAAVIALPHRGPIDRVCAAIVMEYGGRVVLGRDTADVRRRVLALPGATIEVHDDDLTGLDIVPCGAAAVPLVRRIERGLLGHPAWRVRR